MLSQLEVNINWEMDSYWSWLCRAHLQEFRDDGKHLRVADIDGVVSVRLLLVTDIPQVKDRRQ